MSSEFFFAPEEPATWQLAVEMNEGCFLGHVQSASFLRASGHQQSRFMYSCIGNRPGGIYLCLKISAYTQCSTREVFAISWVNCCTTHAAKRLMLGAWLISKVGSLLHWVATKNGLQSCWVRRLISPLKTRYFAAFAIQDERRRCCFWLISIVQSIYSPEHLYLMLHGWWLGKRDT